MLATNQLTEIEAWAKGFFQRALDENRDVYVGLKDTVIPGYDGVMRTVIEEIFESDYRSKFEAQGLAYHYELIDAQAARLVSNPPERALWGVPDNNTGRRLYKLVNALKKYGIPDRKFHVSISRMSAGGGDQYGSYNLPAPEDGIIKVVIDGDEKCAREVKHNDPILFMSNDREAIKDWVLQVYRDASLKDKEVYFGLKREYLEYDDVFSDVINEVRVELVADHTDPPSFMIMRPSSQLKKMITDPPRNALYPAQNLDGDIFSDIAAALGGSLATASSIIESKDGLGSTALDFTTLPMQVGEFIFLGGTALANRFFASPSLDNSGYARIVSIAASAVVLDKVTETFVTDSGTGKLIQIFFGRFLKNVPTDDANFLERSYQFELEYPGLATNGVDSKFSYAAGNFANTMAISMPLADKAGVSFAFIGTDTLPPTETRKAEAENAVEPARTSAYNTTTDCARLRITKVDESGLTTDFKSLTVTLNNNVSPEKVLCNLGAKFMNFGNFEVNIEAQLVFTDSAVIDAVRNNETVAMDFAVKNDDGAIMFDIPAMTLGGGDTEFPVNESVLINITSEAFQDPTTGNSIGISVFPFVPIL